MTNSIRERVMRGEIVDTRTYRYVLSERQGRLEIKRLPIRWLDTTHAIDGWETVEEVG